MIVEDDHDTLQRFAHAVSNDARTSLAQSARAGREAIAQLPAVRPDVLLTDLGLPDIHGTEVIRFAARTQPDCDILVITVFGDERNVLSCVESGASGYVLKDCSDEDLIAHILELRAGGAPMTPGIARLVLNRMRAPNNLPPAAAHDPDRQDAAEVLTSRETEVLRLVSRGYTYAETGERLGISVNTVSSHIKNTYRKLAVHSAAAAVTRASELHLLTRR